MEPEPAVASRRPIEPQRRREVRIGEAADRDTGHVRHALRQESDGDATVRAEEVLNPASGLADVAPTLVLAGHRNGGAREHRGIGESAAALALAGDATAAVD